MQRATLSQMPGSEEHAEQPGQLGWLSRGNAVSGVAGFMTGAAMVLTFLLVGVGRGDSDSVPASAASRIAQFATSAGLSTAVPPERTRELLIARSLARPVSFGDPVDANLVEFAAFQERLFGEALALDAVNATPATDMRLALTTRSRAREIRFDVALVMTPALQAFIEQQEWWALEL